MRHDNGNGEGPVVEWAPFRPLPTTSEAALVEASEALQRDFLARQPGFVRRELLRGPDGQWADLVVWRDEASAKSVMQAAARSPVCLRYFHLMEGGDNMEADSGVLHFHQVRRW